MPRKYVCCAHENTCYIYESYVIVIDHTSTQGTAFCSSPHQLTMLRDPTLLVPWWLIFISSGHRKWIQGWHWSHGPCNCCQVGGFFEDCKKKKVLILSDCSAMLQKLLRVPGYSLKVPEVWGIGKAWGRAPGVAVFCGEKVRRVFLEFPQQDFGEFGWFWRPGSSGRFWSVHPKSSGGSWKVPIGSGGQIWKGPFRPVETLDVEHVDLLAMPPGSWGIRAISPELVLLVESFDSDISKYLPPG